MNDFIEFFGTHDMFREIELNWKYIKTNLAELLTKILFCFGFDAAHTKKDQNIG